MRAAEFTNHLSLEDPEYVISVLSKVEGERWAQEQRSKVVPLSVRYSAKIYQQAKEYHKELPDSSIRELMYDLDSDSVVIYGAGGYNRYVIQGDGYVYPIDESFPNQEKLALAKRLLSGSQISQINEIEKLSKNDWRQHDVDVWVKMAHLSKNLLKKLPGNNTYSYTINKVGDIVIWNNKLKPIARLGVIRVDTNRYTPFPIKNSYSVGAIGVLKDYQGQNLAKSLYGLVLLPPPIGLGGTLLSDTSQTPGGRRNWASLARIPGVEVSGYIMISKDIENMNLIDDLFGRVGGVYIGENKYGVYYQFPITVDRNEVKNLIKNSNIKIYSEPFETEDPIEIGLMARYIG